jgi:hypothetical protein
MPEISSETAYYLSSTLSSLALIGHGVRFPAGQWIRIAGPTVEAWHAEELVADLFPGLRGRHLRFHVLLTEFDVQEFERNERRNVAARKPRP